MADFIISPYAISFNSIKQALQAYIQNKSEVQNTWKDFYVSGAGETILELDSAVAAFYAFHFILGRREAYLPTAQNYASVIGGAQALGYCASRGHNLYLQMDILPTATQTLSRWTVIGQYANYDIVLLEDAILNVGETTTIKCVIGDSVAQNIKITSNALQQFTYTSPDVTDDIRLVLNSDVVPMTTSIKEAIEDKYVAITNTYGAVDVFYLNEGNYKYKADDNLYLQFIQRNTLTYDKFSPENIDIPISELTNNIRLFEDLRGPEDKEHVRLAAPIKHEQNDIIRARKDYKKYLVKSNTNIMDANDLDINPGLIAITYLKKPDGSDFPTVMTTQEKETYIKSMMKIAPDGVAKAFIQDPVLVIRPLKINLWQKPDENIAVTIQEDINKILNTYRNKLAPNLDLEQIEHDIEKLPGVKVARVNFGASDYQTNKKYRLYDMVTIPDVYTPEGLQTLTFYCSRVLAKTGETEPDWSSAKNPGDIVYDRNLIWQNGTKYADSIYAKWKENGDYELYSDIIVGYTIAPDSTTATEPTWGPNLITDGNVSSMLVKKYEEVIGDREVNTKYELDEKKLFHHNNKTGIYTVASITYKTSKEPPRWNSAKHAGDLVIDNALTWELKYFNWGKQESLGIGDLRATTIDGKIYVYMATRDGVTGNTCPFDGSRNVEETNSQGEVIMTWALSETLDNLQTWQPYLNTEVGSYVNEDNKYFLSISNDNYTTDKENVPCVDEDGNWITDIIDNNIIWQLDTYINQYETRNAIGLPWMPESVYTIQDVMIVKDKENTYIYEVYFTGSNPIVENGLIYTVKAHCGTSGKYEPVWGDDNVFDNNILWTVTPNIGYRTWEPETDYTQGDIIMVNKGTEENPEYVYYTFGSIIGTSGNTAPNWLDLKNGTVTDNNIVWTKLIDNHSIQLGWNEYVDLKFTVNIVRQ